MRTVRLALAAVTLSLAACAHDDARPRAPQVDRPVATIRIGGVGAAPARAPVQPRRAAPPSRDALRAELTARRQHHLEVLRAYREAGVFPINYTVQGDGHFLIDDQGTLCAVANLIAQDGHRELIATAARTDNALLFGDVTDGPFLDWILTSGFSQEEIARIQVPAPFVGERPMVQPIEPAPPVLAANERTRLYLDNIERALRAASTEGLEVALDRLQARPDLLVAFARPPAAPVAAPVAVAGMRFASPPPAR